MGLIAISASVFNANKKKWGAAILKGAAAYLKNPSATNYGVLQEAMIKYQRSLKFYKIKK